MSKKTKVLRYTEEEFVTLLENIVNRVKKEEALNESRKPATKRVVKKQVVRKRKA